MISYPSYRIIEDEGATAAATVGYLLPVVSVAHGAIGLSEALKARIVIGMVVVLVGSPSLGGTPRPEEETPGLAGPQRNQYTEPKERLMSVDRAAPFQHGMADIEAGLRIHYVLAGDGPRTIVLLHGFPQTWWQWHRIMPPLVEAGFRVIAPDYRGAGDSWRPTTGYDKRTMACDIRRLLHDHLGVHGPAVIAGHDLGLMVAYAYAQDYREVTSHLVLMDAPLPGTAVFDGLLADPRVWHFAFHGARDVAELLVAGRERQYIQFFVNARIFNTGAITAADLDVYASAYAAPGAMRAAFEAYRAFGQDADDNRSVLRENGKLTMPVLALGGAISTTGAVIEEMTREVADDVTAARIPDTGHWIAEENPEVVLRELLEFTDR